MTPELAVMLGHAAVLGFEPGRLLRAGRLEAKMLEAALEHAATFRGQLDEALAVRIANLLIEAWNKGPGRAGRRGGRR